MKIDVVVTSLSGERLWDYDKPLPAKANISININIMELNRTRGGLETSFVFTINYSPPIAHISVKGRALITGGPEEVETVVKEQERTHQPPTILLQAVSLTCLAEAVVLSKSLHIPPPIPPLAPAPEPVHREAGATSSYTR
ncbi:MAG: hypothetical protein N3H31_03095 [Candidatus Nezhaarchaeota archaeon]|nr:hypothetical protein [Candidatus Nezhaarchaeota archaeon]